MIFSFYQMCEEMFRIFNKVISVIVRKKKPEQTCDIVLITFAQKDHAPGAEGYKTVTK